MSLAGSALAMPARTRSHVRSVGSPGSNSFQKGTFSPPRLTPLAAAVTACIFAPSGSSFKRKSAPATCRLGDARHAESCTRHVLQETQIWPKVEKPLTSGATGGVTGCVSDSGFRNGFPLRFCQCQPHLGRRAVCRAGTGDRVRPCSRAAVWCRAEALRSNARITPARPRGAGGRDEVRQAALVRSARPHFAGGAAAARAARACRGEVVSAPDGFAHAGASPAWLRRLNASTGFSFAYAVAFGADFGVYAGGYVSAPTWTPDGSGTVMMDRGIVVRVEALCVNETSGDPVDAFYCNATLLADLHVTAGAPDWPFSLRNVRARMRICISRMGPVRSRCAYAFPVWALRARARAMRLCISWARALDVFRPPRACAWPLSQVTRLESAGQEGDAVVEKRDGHTGRVLWTTVIGSMLYDEVTSLATTSGGGAVYAAGRAAEGADVRRSVAGADFSDGFLEGPNATAGVARVAFLAKLAGDDGHVVRSRTLAGVRGLRVSLCPLPHGPGAAHVLVAVGTVRSADGINITAAARTGGPYVQLPATQGDDAFVAAFDADSLALLWIRPLGGSLSDVATGVSCFDAQAPGLIPGPSTADARIVMAVTSAGNFACGQVMSPGAARNVTDNARSVVLPAPLAGQGIEHVVVLSLRTVDGGVLWARSVGGRRGRARRVHLSADSLSVDAAGNAAVAIVATAPAVLVTGASGVDGRNVSAAARADAAAIAVIVGPLAAVGSEMLYKFQTNVFIVLFSQDGVPRWGIGGGGVNDDGQVFGATLANDNSYTDVRGPGVYFAFGAVNMSFYGSTSALASPLAQNGAAAAPAPITRFVTSDPLAMMIVGRIDALLGVVQEATAGGMVSPGGLACWGGGGLAYAGWATAAQISLMSGVGEGARLRSAVARVIPPPLCVAACRAAHSLGGTDVCVGRDQFWGRRVASSRSCIAERLECARRCCGVHRCTASGVRWSEQCGVPAAAACCVWPRRRVVCTRYAARTVNDVCGRKRRDAGGDELFRDACQRTPSPARAAAPADSVDAI